MLQSLLIVSRHPASPNSIASFVNLCLPGRAAARPIWSPLKYLSFLPPAHWRETDISPLCLMRLGKLRRRGLELLP